jgi:hypothetical protein
MRNFIKIFLSVAVFFSVIGGALYASEWWIKKQKLQPVADQVALQLKQYLQKNDYSPTGRWLETYIQELVQQDVVNKAEDMQITYTQLNNSARFYLEVSYKYDSLLLVKSVSYEVGLKANQPIETIHLEVVGKTQNQDVESEDSNTYASLHEQVVQEAVAGSGAYVDLDALRIKQTITKSDKTQTKMVVPVDTSEPKVKIVTDEKPQETIAVQTPETKLLASTESQLAALAWTQGQTDLNKADLNKALSDAVIQENISEVKLLLEKGADPNHQSRLGAPLSYALFDNNIEMLKVLLEYGANVSLKDGQGLTLLDTASILGDKKSMELLLNFGGDGYQSLKLAVEQGEAPRVYQLLELGVEVNNVEGSELLTYALIQKDYDVAKLLETYGAPRDPVE